MHIFVIAMIMTCIFCEASTRDEVQLYKDLDTPDIARKYGYTSETHTVTTEDGYLLTLHRVYGRRSSKPLLLVHGILCSSADWVNMGPKRALGLVLADEGYDVWMINLRGNTYSRNHTTIQPITESSEKFWNFSFHEMGLYDLPATIDYVLESTGREMLSYVGHSMGSTAFYIMCSVYPHYNHKIQLMVGLAPVAYMRHAKGIAVIGAELAPEIMPFLNNELHVYELGPTDGWLRLLGFAQCTGFALKYLKRICALSLFTAVGFNSKGLDMSTLEVIFSRFPAGASTKTFFHYAQLIRSGRFETYDYGSSNNLVIYGKDSPLKYNLSQVSAPVSLVWSLNDYLSTRKDVERLARELPNVVSNYRIPNEKFNHVDFLWGYKVNKKVYRYILELLQAHTTQQ